MQGKNRRNLAKFVIILLGIFIPSFIFFGLWKGSIYAATSDAVNLQGKIVRNDVGYEGLNITAGSPTCVVSGSGNDTCDFRVRYYDASSGGNLLLTEEFSNVEIGEYLGVFNLSLGSDSSPTAGVYSSFSGLVQGEDDVYVEMGFDPSGSNIYTEVFTRMPLEATAYAIRAKYADTATGATEVPWSGLQDPTEDLTIEHSTRKTLFNWATGTGTEDLFTLTSNASATGTGALMNVQTGTGSALVPLRVRSGSTEAIYVNSSGNVGIGTTSLTYKLEVDGDTNLSTGSVFRIGGASVLSSTDLGSSVTGSSLTSVGTLTSGTWNASTIGEEYGGTGQTGYAAGDILYASGVNTLAKRAIGSNNQVLTVSGGVPVWSDVGAASSVPFSGITSGTNTTAAMVVGAGASLNYTSTGTINASSLQGSTWAVPGAIGSTTPNTGAFTTLSASTSLTTPLVIGTSNSLTLRPTTNAVDAIRLANAAGTAILSVDTTNSRVGIGTNSPDYDLDVIGNISAVGNIFANASIDSPYGGIGSGQNLFLNSSTLGGFSAMDTTKTGGFSAPDNSDTAVKLEVTSDIYAYSSLYDEYITNPANRTFTFSIWLKMGNITNITIGIGHNGGSLVEKEITLTSDWKRYYLTYSFNSTSWDRVKVRINLNANGSSGDGEVGDYIYAWGAQLEEDSNAGIYVKTGSSIITTDIAGVYTQLDSHLMGDVGIGTTSPTEKLHISAGNVRIDNMTTAGVVKNSSTGVLSGGNIIDAGDITTGSLVDGTKITMGGTLTDRLVGTGNVTVGLSNSAAYSVIGNATGSSAAPSDISAASDHQVLRRSGTSLGFGAINLASSNAVTGILPYNNGGTGQNTYAKGDILFASDVNTLAKRAIGTAGQVLTVSGGLPVWTDVSSITEDNYVDSLDFNTSTGDLTVGRTGILPDLVESLDGRYGLASSLYGNWVIKDSSGDTGATVGSGEDVQFLNGTNITTTRSSRNVTFATVTNPTFSTSVTTPLVIGTSNSLTLRPTTNAVNAIRLANAGGTAILSVDTTSSRVGIGTTSPSTQLHTTGGVRFAGITSSTQTTAVMADTNGNLSTRALGSLAFDSSLAFLDLSDVTETTYTGSGGQLVAVNAGATGLEFVSSVPASSVPFSGITSGTNTSASMVVGAGASLVYNGGTVYSGGINSNYLLGSTWVVPGAIGSTTPNTGAFTTVGIGTTSPSTQLHTTGGVRFAGITTGTETTAVMADTSGNLSTRALGNLAFENSVAGDNWGTQAVESDATLTGTGVIGSLLGLNLANANTWTGSQTFSASTYFPGSGVWNSSGNVGIGTTPSYKLDVSGGTGIVGRFSGRVIGADAVNTNEFVTKSQLDSVGGSITTYWQRTSPNLSPINANDNILPNTSGDLGAAGSRWGTIYGNTGSFSVLQGNSTLTLLPSSDGINAVNIMESTGTTEIFSVDTINSRIGIGTASPDSALHVAGQVKITGGLPGANKVLTSDVAGLASWSELGDLGGVTSVTGTTNQITASPTTGDVILSIPTDFRAPGTVNAVNGIYTGATAGTQRIDSSGNLLNIGTITFAGGDVVLSRTLANVLSLASGDSFNLTSGSLQVGSIEVITSGRLIRAANGSATTPAFSFSSDTNTGMYSGGTDILKFATAGSDRVTVLADGKVGIGTTSPMTLLHVAGSGGVFQTIENTGTGWGVAATRTNYKNESSQLVVGIEGSMVGTPWEDSTAYYGLIGTTSNYGLHFGTNGDVRMTILNDGKVGIGDKTPDSLFSIGSTSQFQVDTAGDITKIKNLSYTWPTAHTTDGYLKNNGTGGLSWTEVNAVQSTGTPYGSPTEGPLAFWTSPTTISAPTPYGLYWDDINQYLGIGTNTPSAPLDIAGGTGGSLIKNSSGDITIEPAENLIISQGDVGIGTDNPLAKLHVKGNQILIKNEADADVGFVLDSGSTTTYRDVISFRDRGTDVFALEKTSTNAFQLYDYSGSGVSRLLFGAGSNSGISMRTTGTGDFSFINDTTTRVTIKSDGKVGIGMTPTYALDVSGDLRASGLLFQSSSGIHVAVKDDLTTRISSGFWESSTATTSEGWPVTTNSWYHLLTSTHSNMGNYYSMQFAADFFNSNNLYYRSTANSGTTTWRKIITDDGGGNVGIGTTNPITTANTKLHVYSSSTVSNMIISSTDYATLNMMSGNVSGQGFGDLSVNAYWDGTAWSKRNTSYESWIIGMATRTDSNGKIEFVHSNAGTGFTMTKPMIIKPNSVYFGDYLEVFSGNAKTVSTPFIRASSSNNLVLNGYSGGGVYLNWDSTGTGGVYVGDGAGVNKSNQVFTLGSSAANRGRIYSQANDALANSADANAGLEVGPYRVVSAASGNSLYEYYSNASSVAYRILTTGTAMDLAEWYPVGNIDLDSNRNSTIKKGEILCMDNLDATKVVKCDSAHTNIIGIASTASYTTMGIKDMDDLREDDVEVALTGRVPAIVTSKNGPISIGDFITYSNLRGVGQKATQKVQVVAKALDSFNPSSCTPASSLESIVWPIDENGDNPTRPCYQLPDGTFVGKIMVFPNISVYNPSETYTTINITNPGWYRISQLNGTDDNAKFKINNSSIGSSQNLILSVDTVNEKENINIVSNFVSGGYDISKARINTVNGVKYLEIYLETVNNNRINVSIEGNITNWISTSIEYVENPTIVNKEFSFSGVLFGVSNMLKVEETGLKVGGDLIANTNTANIGDITNRWNDIYAQGTVRLGSSTDSGGIKYNPETKRLELSNDGETWIPIGSSTRSVLLSAQYPGSVVLDGLVNNMGEMTMNNTGLGNASMNYYQWESSESNLNDKEINITYQLPSDFKEWGSGGITLSFATESISALDNKIDLYVYEQNASGYDGISEGNISTVNEKWQTTKIDGSQLNMCNKAEDVCVIQIKMSSSLNNYARVGDIQIKYERTL